jgi:hypothetical protein
LHEIKRKMSFLLVFWETQWQFDVARRGGNGKQFEARNLVSARDFGHGARGAVRWMDGVVRGEACMTNAASNLQLTTRAWPKTQRESKSGRAEKSFLRSWRTTSHDCARYYDAKATQNMLFGSAIISERPTTAFFSSPRRASCAQQLLHQNRKDSSVGRAKKNFFPQSCRARSHSTLAAK